MRACIAIGTAGACPSLQQLPVLWLGFVIAGMRLFRAASFVVFRVQVKASQVCPLLPAFGE